MIWPRWYEEKFQHDYNFLNKTIYELPLLGSVWHKVANIAIAPTFGQHLDNFFHMMPPDDKQISRLCEKRICKIFITAKEIPECRVKFTC